MEFIFELFAQMLGSAEKETDTMCNDMQAEAAYNAKAEIEEPAEELHPLEGVCNIFEIANFR